MGSLRKLPQRFITKHEIGPYAKRLKRGFVVRPHYGYCIYHAATLARMLGQERICAVELGVAGGNGLLAMEYHAREAEKATGTKVDIYGFDTGEGLPAPVDHRDLPYHWKGGFYKMDVPALQARLTKAKLILGPLEQTAPRFFEEHAPAPIGMVSFDVDFYSSTMEAFPLLEGPDETHLPRVFCYFDDVIGTDIVLYDDFTGERLAIHDFNRAHEDRKIGIPYHLLVNGRKTQEWHHKIRIFHAFQHAQYGTFVSEEDQQLPLR